MQKSSPIVIIARNTAWQQALKAGEYTQSTLDSTLAEVGFIHCSFPNQTLDIANRRFLDQENLILLLIDTQKVTSPIKYETALSGRPGLFPHIYGPLTIDAVYKTIPLKKGHEGKFIKPSALFT